MPSIWVSDFKRGLDTRRLPEMSPSGSLALLQDGHINRGGEIEQRAAFVPVYALPSGATRSMAYAGSQIVVFGESAAPALPTGVIYQRLVHPVSAGLRLARVLSFEFFAGKVYAVGQFEDGGVYHYYDGARVTDWNDKRARARINVTGGLAGGAVSSITVGGVEALGAAVAYTGDVVSMAQALADQINAYLSNPDYVAVAFLGSVAILANAAGAASNGLAVVVTAANVSFTQSGNTAGGIDDVATYQSATYVRTATSKLFALTGGELHFSGINQPTKWFSVTTYPATGATGAGFVALSDQASNADTLTAVTKYQNYYAVFSPRTVQIVYNDPDPSMNKQVQVLSNTGTLSPRSVTQYGDSDVFYLDESGIRSLRARDASNAAATTDIGVPVDTIIIAALQALTESQRLGIISVIEPASGRYWLAIGRTIYVFSAFQEAAIKAWSTYTLPFAVEDMFVKPADRRVYVRSGDTIYVYGGVGAVPAYDDTPVVAWLPYLDGGAPAASKDFIGIDVACRGVWEIRAAMNVENQDATDVNSRIDGTTFSAPDIFGVGEFTHIALRLKSLARPASGGPVVLSAIGVHYRGENSHEA